MACRAQRELENHLGFLSLWPLFFPTYLDGTKKPGFSTLPDLRHCRILPKFSVITVKKQFTREVITWEKQPDISTAGHAPVPASGVDSHLWRVPHQPAQPSPSQSLLFGVGCDRSEKERATPHLLPRQTPRLSFRRSRQKQAAGQLA